MMVQRTLPPHFLQLEAEVEIQPWPLQAFMPAQELLAVLQAP